MQPVEVKRGEEQRVYAASGGKERQKAACICSQWRQREAKSSVYMQPVEVKRGEEQRVYAASGGEERRRAACLCSQWRRRAVCMHRTSVGCQSPKDRPLCIMNKDDMNLKFPLVQ